MSCSPPGYATTCVRFPSLRICQVEASQTRVPELCGTFRKFASCVALPHQPPGAAGGCTAPRLGRRHYFRVGPVTGLVSRQEILEILPELSADPDLVALVHALHHKSSYRLAAQGSTTTVATTTGIKQGCKVAPSLFALLTGKLITQGTCPVVWGAKSQGAFLPVTQMTSPSTAQLGRLLNWKNVISLSDLS